jgi:hypothetical protein
MPTDFVGFMFHFCAVTSIKKRSNDTHQLRINGRGFTITSTLNKRHDKGKYLLVSLTLLSEPVALSLSFGYPVTLFVS